MTSMFPVNWLAARYRVLALEARLSAPHFPGAAGQALARAAGDWERRAAAIEAGTTTSIQAAAALIAADERMALPAPAP